MTLQERDEGSRHMEVEEESRREEAESREQGRLDSTESSSKTWEITRGE